METKDIQMKLSVSGKAEVRILSRRILSSGASSRLLLEVWRLVEDKLSTEHVRFC